MPDFKIDDFEKLQANELEERLKKIKAMFDKAYLETRIKYGEKQAKTAVYNYFMNSDAMYFTGKDNRKKLKALLYHPNEIYQLLLDFAISTYLYEDSQGIKHKATLTEAKKYTDFQSKDLNYDEDYITSIVALSTAWSPYWTTNLVSCNEELKKSLVKAFIKGRYTSVDQRKKLDNSKKSKIIFEGKGQMITMSKYQLNRSIANMTNDDCYEPFDPDNIPEEINGKKL